jgi:hypothetical protein
MDSFTKVLVECRKKESTRMLHNASIEHAKVLFENLIDMGRELKEPIRIVSGKLNTEFYGQLTDKAEQALKENTPIELVVVDPDINLDDNPFANIIRESGGHVYQTTEKIEYPHFILVGEKRFRLETDHAQTKAVACFNNIEVGTFLHKMFNLLKDYKLIEKVSLSTANASAPAEKVV